LKRDHEIVFEDDHIVVVNKAAGLLTIPDRYQHDKRNLSSLMIDKYGEIFVVHRIDRETSGLIMFAKNAETHKALSEAFEENKIDKTYLALVQGTPNPLEDRIETFLVKSETERSKIMVFKSLDFEVPLPKDMKAVVNQMRKVVGVV